ncbi:reverse transcriptase domain, reverse transcriptase zinc-binding domain protein [Tanacetum coccineum]
MKEAVDKGVFKGIKIGRKNVVVSHLQYADDTIFFGKWNKENAKALMCILNCFEQVSGLRVNYNKSKLYGVGVNEEELRDMARWMRCGVGEFLFTYLGLSIGDNMRRVGAWDNVLTTVLLFDVLCSGKEKKKDRNLIKLNFSCESSQFGKNL